MYPIPSLNVKLWSVWWNKSSPNHLSACSASFAFWTSSSFSPLILISSLGGSTLKQQQSWPGKVEESLERGVAPVRLRKPGLAGRRQRHWQLPALARHRGGGDQRSRLYNSGSLRQACFACAAARQVAEEAAARQAGHVCSSSWPGVKLATTTSQGLISPNCHLWYSHVIEAKLLKNVFPFHMKCYTSIYCQDTKTIGWK